MGCRQLPAFYWMNLCKNEMNYVIISTNRPVICLPILSNFVLHSTHLLLNLFNFLLNLLLHVLRLLNLLLGLLNLVGGWDLLLLLGGLKTNSKLRFSP